jgi:protein involved in polysaccharide export with SLBB domain
VTIIGFVVLPVVAESAFRLEGDDLVLRLNAGTPGPFQLMREEGEIRVRLPEGTAELDLTLPDEPRKLLTAARWEVDDHGPTVVLELGAGTFRSIESAPEGIRVLITATLQPLDAYLIGPGDVLDVEVFGEKDLSGSLTVDPAGNVRMILIGKVRAAGLTTEALAERIQSMLAEEFLQDPRVRVEVVEYKSHEVTVLGPVVLPGNIAVLGPTRLSKIIRLAKGFTDKAGYRLTVRRELSDGTVHTVEIGRQELEEGREDPLILPDDLITVAEAEIFFIDGEVGRPSAYPLMPNLTLMKAIAFAGGTTPWANETEIEIHRQVGGRTLLETHNLKKIRAHRAPDPRLRPGDLVRVPRRFL